MRNLVVCCDGTWNTPDQREGGIPVPTNVVKLFNACESSEAQLKYYHPGVGTEGSKLKRMVDGGIGRGLDQNIQSAYNWLCAHYQPGDRIFLFGFSRGAYTVRSLGGFILRVGLLDLSGLTPAQAWARVGTAYEKGYRGRLARERWGARWPCLADVQGAAPDVHFIGVWDTVGARGVPDDIVWLDALIDDPARYSFHDTVLSPRVRHAYHAVAMNEWRASFAPTLWTVNAPRPEGSSFEQRWFPGDHCDVGGGHVQCGLSDAALQWMADRARAQGLGLDDRLMAQLKPDHHGVLHDSIDGIWKHMRTLPRALPKMCAENVEAGVLHPVSWRRHIDPPISQAPFRPSTELAPGQAWSGNIYALQLWNDTGLWLEAGVRYRFSASGEWVDMYNRSGPEGMSDSKFQIGELAYRLGDVIELGEEMYQKLTGKKEADWWATRRFNKGGWFQLVGMLANQADVDGSGTPPSGETFAIGTGRDFTPTRSGYLYCYANDAWRFYGNNRGSVNLRVVRD